MEVTDSDSLIGALVADRYRVVRKLGEGGMGVVYHAVHEALHKPVALKVLASGGRLDKEAVARFEREAIAAANLRHPNIAEATDFGKLDGGGLYLVMEYVEGTTLRQLLRQSGGLPSDRALSILQQVGSALATAHSRDVVHRDLKPENIIITSSPVSLSASSANLQAAQASKDFVKVIDFGIAKIRNATFGIGGGATAALTRAGMVFGTPEYMAPEQVMGQVVDARADQYALGVLAFEVLTGKPPFQADDTGQLMMMHVGAPIPSTRTRTPSVPIATDEVIAKMLSKLPDERYPSVEGAMNALAATLAPLTSFGGPTSGASPGSGKAPMNASSGAFQAIAASLSGSLLEGAPASINNSHSSDSVSAQTNPGAHGGTTVRLGAGGLQNPLASSQSHVALAAPTPAPMHGSGAQALTPNTLRSVALPLPATSAMPASGPMGPQGSNTRNNAGPNAPYAAGASLSAGSNEARNLAPRTPKLPVWLLGAGGFAAVLFILLFIFIARSFVFGSLPKEVTQALSDWKSGNLAPAAAALSTAIVQNPELANDVVVAKTLAENINRNDVAQTLGNLLETTSLGNSTVMASALAEQAIKDEEAFRNPALSLLRDRLGLLNKEQAARVKLRDAEDCEEFEVAQAELRETSGVGPQRDLERIVTDDCKRMVREREVCEKCKGGKSKGPGLGNPGGKPKGKKDKKGKD